MRYNYIRYKSTIYKAHNYCTSSRFSLIHLAWQSENPNIQRPTTSMEIWCHTFLHLLEILKNLQLINGVAKLISVFPLKGMKKSYGFFTRWHQPFIFHQATKAGMDENTDLLMALPKDLSRCFRSRSRRANKLGWVSTVWLVGSLEYCFILFHIRNNPSIWRTHLFQRGWKHQPDDVGFWMCFVHLWSQSVSRTRSCSYLLGICFSVRCPF